jgi:hypothetical protein
VVLRVSKSMEGSGEGRTLLKGPAALRKGSGGALR